MTALKKAPIRESERNMWGVGKTHTPHIPRLSVGGRFFQKTQL